MEVLNHLNEAVTKREQAQEHLRVLMTQNSSKNYFKTLVASPELMTSLSSALLTTTASICGMLQTAKAWEKSNVHFVCCVVIETSFVASITASTAASWATKELSNCGQPKLCKWLSSMFYHAKIYCLKKTNGISCIHKNRFEKILFIRVVLF